jgi:hypothetical protein
MQYPRPLLQSQPGHIKPQRRQHSKTDQEVWVSFYFSCFTAAAFPASRSIYALFATGIKQIPNRPNGFFNPRSHCRGHPHGPMDFARAVIGEIQGHSSCKILQFFAESAAMNTATT